MLKIKTEHGTKLINKRLDFNILYDYEGDQILTFDIYNHDHNYKYIKEEVCIEYRDNIYIIKKINRRKQLSTIECSLNLNELRSSFYHFYTKKAISFSDIILDIMPSCWNVIGSASVVGNVSLELEGVSAYEILMKCKSLFNIVFEYHTKTKTIKVVKPDTYQSRGLYISEELNLSELSFNGDSSTYATRLYAYGKKIENKDEDGTVTSIDYVNFASINGGKPYIDNNEYSKDIIVAYWQDNDYEDIDTLYTDAIEKLKTIARPVRSYDCTLIDLSRINQKYQCLDFQLYDKVTLLDHDLAIQHQIVQYQEYPDNPNKNVVTLSSTFKKITGTIDGIQQSIGSIDTEIKRTENAINEIIRDVESNTARIQNTYTKGETDIQIASVVQQSADTIHQSITKLEESIKSIDTTYYHAELTSSGTSITYDNSSITMSVQLLNKSDEVTTPSSVFNWKRVSNNVESDTIWNDAHKGRKSIVITSSDLEASANFYCEVSAAEWQGSTSAVTVVDETKIPQLGNSFLNVTGVQSIQTLNIDGSYSPSWVQTNPVITPSVIDGVLDIPLNKCTITYKRVINGTEQALANGENVNDGILTISKNIMDNNLSAITYIAYITYKEVTIKLYTSFSLNVMAQDGNDGTPGKDGKEIKSIQTLFAISTSKSIAPTSEWNVVQPIWSSGKYLWKKQIYTFSDDSISETNAEVDTSWEAVNEASTDLKQDIANTEVRITQSYNSTIEESVKNIKLFVNESLAEVGNWQSEFNKLENQMVMNSAFTDFVRTSTQKIEDLKNGKIDINEIQEWARFDGATLELGASNSIYKTKLTTTELGFYQGITKVAWISNNELHVTRIVAEISMQSGTFIWEDEKDYGSTFKKVGG